MKYAAVAWVALVLAACDSGFSDEEIERAKASIRTEFEKQNNVKVTEVALIRESPRKLTGYARMTASVLGISREISKNCTATMGEGSRQYIWECK
jgi:hypothetical protein